MNQNLPTVQGERAVDVRIVDGKIIPETLDELWRVSCLLSDSGLVPRDFADQPQKIMIAAAHGMELGLSCIQAMQSIAVINGRPAIWGDAMLGIIVASGTVESWSETYEGDYPSDGFKAICTAKRSGGLIAFTNEFSVAEAKQAGLYPGKDTWKKYLKRMLKMRARSFTLRDGWPDVLRGLHSVEELRDGAIPVESQSRQAVETEQPGNSQKPAALNIIQPDELKKPEDAPEPTMPARASMSKSGVEGEEEAPIISNIPTQIAGFMLGDLVYYNIGQGVGWTRVKILEFKSETDVLIEIAESVEKNGTNLAGISTVKLIADLRKEKPESDAEADMQPLERSEFINLRAGFNHEYLEGIAHRLQWSEGDVIEALVEKAAKKFGTDYRVPGVPDSFYPEMIVSDQQECNNNLTERPHVDEVAANERPTYTGAPTDQIGDEPGMKSLKRLHALTSERGFFRDGIKLAMPAFSFHPKNGGPTFPFAVSSTKLIQVQHVCHWENFLDSLMKHHGLMIDMEQREKRTNGLIDFVKIKMGEFPTPVFFDKIKHWYCLLPRTVSHIQLNLGDWENELIALRKSESVEQPFVESVEQPF